MSDSVSSVGRLRWKRCFLLTWLALISFCLAVRFYFDEFHTGLCWLIQNEVPMTDWIGGYFELDNQIFPLFLLAVITILTLFQNKFGPILLLLVMILFTIGAGVELVQHYCFNAPNASSLSLAWIFFVPGLVLSVAVCISLIVVELIDEKLKSVKTSEGTIHCPS